MSCQAVKQLREPPSAELANSSALDVLNKSFADSAHLDDLRRTLDDALHSKTQLEQQLAQSEKDIDELTTNTRIRAVIQLENAKELATLRDSLEDDLAYLSHDLVSALSPAGTDNTPTLLEDIETLHRTLKELEGVRSYIAVVEHTLQLSECALSQICNSRSPITAASTSQYQTLLTFVKDVRRSCGPVEEVGSSHGSLNLLSFLERVCEKTWADIKAALFSTLISASENLKWPTAVDYVTASKEDRLAFESAVTDLLQLQEIGESLRPPRDDGLYPLQALVQPVALRFRYHFDSERETNRLDKPEWYFTHIANVAHDHRPFMEGVMQKIISGSKFQDVNVWHNYTTILLPILERKLKRSVPLLLTRPALLAHTVYQSLIFDSGLRDMGYEFVSANRETTDDEVERGGISKVILDEKAWFEAWLEGERKFADDQYHEIISAPDAWVIADDDGHDRTQNLGSRDADLKATTSARRVKALVEQVTDRYSPLPSFRQRTQFLVHVQLPILESYHSRVSSSLDAFETLSSVFVRAVPGALGVEGPKTDSRKLTGGVEGSQRLCKALLSAKYIENAMRIWGEEVFFLELLAEINHRASLRTMAGSRSMKNARPNDEVSTTEDTIFEELIKQFAKLSSRAEDMLMQQICGECESAFKTHLSALASHLQDLDEDSTAQATVSSTLLPAVALLSSHLTFLRTTLPAAIVTRLYRRIASRLSEHILQRQIFFRPGLARGHGLTRTEGRVVQAECELWAETSHLAMNTSRSRTEKPWSRVLVAGRLLGADLQQHERLLDVLFGGNSDGWEELIDDKTGLGAGGLGIDEVKTVLRLREDCRR